MTSPDQSDMRFSISSVNGSSLATTTTTKQTQKGDVRSSPITRTEVLHERSRSDAAVTSPTRQSTSPSLPSTAIPTAIPSMATVPQPHTTRDNPTPSPSTSNPVSKKTYSPRTSTPSRTLIELAIRLATKGPVKTQATPRRIRILFNGAMIADTLGTNGAQYIWEHERYPQFYLPMEAFVQPANFDVHLTPGDSIEDPATSQIIGGGLRLEVKRSDAPDTEYKTLTAMVLFAADLTGPGRPLRNMVKVGFDAVGQWFEEDTPIYVHPKDPFKRVDVLASSRPMRVRVNDVVVASSSSSVHLYETDLPPRYYIPLTAVDTSVLRPSSTRSQCPYKGDAAYHSVVVRGELFKDLVWYYTRPTLECAAIAGLCCFWNEMVDLEFEVGGRWVRQDRPKTHFF